ncbi:MAG: helix-hairpin-helix domain-containing protein [Methylococcales bacterium]
MKIFITLLVALFSINLSAKPVNVNTADAQTISESLKGIGQKKADEIIRYRTKNGKFKSPADLINVKGIGQKTVDKNSRDILVKKAKSTKKAKKSKKQKNTK